MSNSPVRKSQSSKPASYLMGSLTDARNAVGTAFKTSKANVFPITLLLITNAYIRSFTQKKVKKSKISQTKAEFFVLNTPLRTESIASAFTPTGTNALNAIQGIIYPQESVNK